MQLPERVRHIVVEGPIGAGKTSLARKLAEAFGAETLLEDPSTNPFLASFYDDPQRHALATQLFFLFQRIDQVRGLKQGDLFRAPVVADFFFEKDALFAELTLSESELALYRKIFEHLAPQSSPPDLVIYLQASARTLVNRVRRRGEEYERGITESYLARLAEAYSRYFLSYDSAPVLVVNSDRVNFVDKPEDFALLLQRVTNLRGSREYFNIGV